MPDPLLSVEHLTMRFGGLLAVDDVSFSAESGRITAVIGPNGAGKTTVFNCLTGFYRPTAGRNLMRRDGRAHLLERMDGDRIAGEAGVARTFQNIRLFGGMTVLENLLVAQHRTLMRASGYALASLFGLAGYKRAEQAAIDRAARWLERLRLLDRADDRADSLPYGAQRRLEIARALCTDPVLLCLDEPAAGLNPVETAELRDLLAELRAELGIGILLIEHDMSLVMEISDTIVVLDHGQAIAAGAPAAIRDDPAVIRAYLGEDSEDEALGAA